MTRSEAALKRRASKRNRTLEEQRRKDNIPLGSGENGGRKRKKTDAAHVKDTSINKVNRGGNANRFSRGADKDGSANNGDNDGTGKRSYKVISKGGFKIMVPKRNSSNKLGFSNRTSRMKWPEQAGPERIKYNQNLRERYKEDPSKLDQVELERALLLLKRDQRKKEKKLKQKMERERKKEMKRIRKEKRKGAGSLEADKPTKK